MGQTDGCTHLEKMFACSLNQKLQFRSKKSPYCKKKNHARNHFSGWDGGWATVQALPAARRGRFSFNTTTGFSIQRLWKERQKNPLWESRHIHHTQKHPSLFWLLFHYWRFVSPFFSLLRRLRSIKTVGERQCLSRSRCQINVTIASSCAYRLNTMWGWGKKKLIPRLMSFAESSGKKNITQLNLEMALSQSRIAGESTMQQFQSWDLMCILLLFCGVDLELT